MNNEITITTDEYKKLVVAAARVSILTNMILAKSKNGLFYCHEIANVLGFRAKEDGDSDD